ncbi:DinB family protein [Limnoraphis robusta]|uniref:DinB family protein n=1 Tax=Limnoraphis robusta TaxID=1118279 RepID=UPI002B1F546D|nr:DinB family protein [Limnoraphis robusta]MEA5496601.1 DinB family protein [Limnoraphis robusta BA-68 BA1]
MTHPLISHFQMIAQYNVLANRKLYEVCAVLSDDERQQIRPAFFKSIHGTLNHILIGDRIWMTRFQGLEIPSTGLNAILYEDFLELRQVREAEDQKILAFFADLDENFLTQNIQYRNNAGNIHVDPVELLITHFFNHQTHHRGQIHDLLTQTSVKPPSLDMHRILRPDPVEKPR